MHYNFKVFYHLLKQDFGCVLFYFLLGFFDSNSSWSCIFLFFVFLFLFFVFLFCFLFW